MKCMRSLQISTNDISVGKLAFKIFNSFTFTGDDTKGRPIDGSQGEPFSQQWLYLCLRKRDHKHGAGGKSLHESTARSNQRQSIL